MKSLSRQAFQRGRAFLKAQARPLDRALFAHRFEGAPAEAAFAELSRYRNDDDGFCHALEPDLRTPSSSALTTDIAKSEALPGPTRARHLARLRSIAPAVVSRDPTEWAGHSIQPLKVATAPHSPKVDLIWNELEANLDYQVTPQAADGAWEPNWTWGHCTRRPGSRPGGNGAATWRWKPSPPCKPLLGSRPEPQCHFRREAARRAPGTPVMLLPRFDSRGRLCYSGGNKRTARLVPSATGEPNRG